MRSLAVGVLLGVGMGVFLGVLLARISDAVAATGIRFGAGVWIFALEAFVRYVAERTDKAFDRFKEGKGG